MLFRTHLVFGMLLFLSLYKYVDNPLLLLIGVLVGSLFVDLDSKNSTVGGYFLFRPMQAFFKHRGFFHSLLFGTLIMIIIAAFSPWLALGFIIGFIGHLFLDSLTKRKVAAFWPISKKKYGFGLIKSGGLIEMILFVVILFADIFLFYILMIK